MANQKGYKDNAGVLSKPDVEAPRSSSTRPAGRCEGELRKKDGKELAIRFVIPSQVAVVAAGVAAGPTC